MVNRGGYRSRLGDRNNQATSSWRNNRGLGGSEGHRVRGLNRTDPPLRSKFSCGCSVGAWGLLLLVGVIVVLWILL